jgi:hypothetical protein
MSDVEQEQESAGISLPVNWHYPENLQSRYANNMLVQSGQLEFVISFFEVQLPLLLGKPQENKVKLEQLGSITAECVSKIIVSPELVPVIINALQVGLENYRLSKSSE